MPSLSMREKVALISGGSRGLGLLIGEEICRRGGNVSIIARDLDELAHAKGRLEKHGRRVLTIQCDLLDRSQIESAVRQTAEHFGRIDVLINNAGVIEVGPFEHMKREDFERSMGVHFWAPFELMMQVIPLMRRQGGGRIANIASIGGKVAVPHMAPYTASKFALVGLSDALRAELARNNIFVTTVTPGLMRTGSEVHAKFKGDHKSEFKIFSSSARIPLVSISAERAARKIVASIERGRPALVMPLMARALITANAIFPNMTARVMKIVNDQLPGPVEASGDEARTGAEIQ